MTFKISRNNFIESDQGYSLEILGKVGIKYRENEKSMMIDSEILAESFGVCLYQDSIKEWMPPFDVERIDEDKKKKIIQNIRSAFAFMKIKLEII